LPEPPALNLQIQNLGALTVHAPMKTNIAYQTQNTSDILFLMAWRWTFVLSKGVANMPSVIPAPRPASTSD